MPTGEELSRDFWTLQERLSKLSEAILRISDTWMSIPSFARWCESAPADRLRRRVVPGAAELGDGVPLIDLQRSERGRTTRTECENASSVDLSAVGKDALRFLQRRWCARLAQLMR